jgi:hypothetical protein
VLIGNGRVLWNADAARAAAAERQARRHGMGDASGTNLPRLLCARCRKRLRMWGANRYCEDCFGELSQEWAFLTNLQRKYCGHRAPRKA